MVWDKVPTENWEQIALLTVYKNHTFYINAAAIVYDMRVNTFKYGISQINNWKLGTNCTFDSL